MTEAARQGALQDEEFDRLSVAYGLTEDVEMIGRIIPASQIPDFHLPEEPDRLDRDDLYYKP